MIRKIAKEMEIYSYLPDLAGGSIVWLINGINIKKRLLSFMDRILPGYKIESPSLGSNKLWKKSGHLDHFKENMYIFQNSALKPMNCPYHTVLAMELYKVGYPIPIIISEHTLVYRKEYTGGLLPPFRSNTFTQDDSHVYTYLNDVPYQFENFIESTLNFYKKCNFIRVKTVLALAPEGDNERIAYSNKFLRDKIAHFVDEIVPEEGAFYGPKVEFHLTDHNGKEWQCGTIQLDFLAEQKFKLPGKSDDKVMIHRAMMGSLERFVGILLSSTQGYLPYWLHPNPYLIMIFESNEKYRFKEYDKDRMIIGLKSIRRRYKKALSERTRLILFFGEEEYRLERIKVQVYLPNKILNFSVPFSSWRKRYMQALVDRVDGLWYLRK